MPIISTQYIQVAVTRPHKLMTTVTSREKKTGEYAQESQVLKFNIESLRFLLAAPASPQVTTYTSGQMGSGPGEVPPKCTVLQSGQGRYPAPSSGLETAGL